MPRARDARNLALGAGFRPSIVNEIDALVAFFVEHVGTDLVTHCPTPTSSGTLASLATCGAQT